MHLRLTKEDFSSFSKRNRLACSQTVLFLEVSLYYENIFMIFLLL